MKKIYIIAGIQDHYAYNETRFDGPDRIDISGYDNLMELLSSPEKREIRNRPIEVQTRNLDGEKKRQLERDMISAGFKKLVRVA